MARLHQLLAVESDLEGKYKRVCDETKKVFAKPGMFTGSHRKLVSFDDSDKTEHPEEFQALTTTVEERLKYTSVSISTYFDALYQKEATNQLAKADLIVDGVIIAQDVPATFLLGLESRLRHVRSIYETIPTLAAGTEWKKSEDKGTGVWDMIHPEEKLRTKMTFKSQILAEATVNHPAQIEKWEEQVAVGKFVKHVWCSMFTSNKKSEVLGRIDSLLLATKKARQQANSATAVNGHVGDAIMAYINTGA
jgi:hypothetical protein